MKSHNLFFALALQIVFSLSAFGQNKATAVSYLVQKFGKYENADPSLNHGNFFEAMSAKMQLAAGSKMVLSETISGKNGYTHYKFKQYHDGVPVFGNSYILHEKNGIVVRSGGHFSPNIGQSPKPGMNSDAAIAFAKQKKKTIRYAEKQPQPMLCYIDPAFPKVSETLRLAYQVDLYSTEPFDKRRYFVDATSGKLLCEFPLILQEGVPSTAKTKYYGVQNIITDSIGPQQFELHDPTRGEGITVFQPDESLFTSTSSDWDLTNNQQDEVALDAHYCSQEYFDLMTTAFDWEGLDGNGKALKVMVHNNGAGPVNAFWDGEFTNYGDGSCNYGPLTTLEVVGHEFTHGMIDHTSKLVYASESGAINESLADIFGKILERTTTPADFSWDLGHSFLLTPEAEPFRIMDDPASVGMPDYYKGALWVDFAGVHTNSAIGNLWFSMIVDGKQGTNEIGVDYNVQGMGIEKAGQIVFLVNKAYFSENSDYSDFYDYSMQAAEELYGAGSAEQLAVQEAWNAVGLPVATSAVLDLSLGAAYIVEGTCGLNEYHTVSFSVINSGTIPYEASMGAKVILSDFDENLPDFTYDVAQPLAPGEVLEVNIPDWFLVADPSTYFVNLDLDFEDEEPNNNYGWVAFNLVEYEANDVYLNAYTLPQPCFSTVLETSFYLSSNSCQTIPAFTDMEIRAENLSGTVLWSKPYTLEYDLEGFGTTVFTEQLSLNGLGVNDSIRFVLDYAADPAIENNISYVVSSGLESIAQDYLNNFNNELSLEGNWLELLYYFAEPLAGYQGDTYFASTGSYTDPESFEHCLDYETNFDNEFFGGINATIRACVDFSNSPNPYLEFDLVLLKNEFAVAKEYPYSSMLQAKWTGSQSGNVIIFDQENGEQEHHGYQLPPNFKGELLLKFYTEIGQWDIDTENFGTDDFVLLDNLQLRSAFTSADEAQMGQLITVSPNPTQSSVNLKSAGAMRALMLYDVSGRLVKTLQVNATTANLDLHELKTGFYLLNVQLENGQWAVQKLVKI